MTEIKDFQILNTAIDQTTLNLLCDEMDTVVKTAPIHPGRFNDTLRYKVHKESSPELLCHKWIASTLSQFKFFNDQTVSLTAYVRQLSSNGLHSDHNPREGEGYTLLLPLRDIEKDDCTVVFNHSTASKEIINLKQSIFIIRNEIRNNPSHNHIDRYKLYHVHKWVDQMDLLGVFPYRLGDAVLFKGHLLHCSNDWKKINPDRTHKDYLLVHTRSVNSLAHDETHY